MERYSAGRRARMPHTTPTRRIRACNTALLRKEVPLKSLATALVLAAAALHAETACSQEYPSKPIRIMTSEIGGGTDITARLLAQGISGPLGQAVIIDNRGSRFLGPLGAKAAPDGYTLVAAASTFLLGPLLEKTAYDPIKDFAPITIATR